MTNSASETLAAISAARLGWMTGQPGNVNTAEMNQLESTEAHLRLLAMDAQFRCLTAAPPAGLDLTHVADFIVPEQIYPEDAARERFRRTWSDIQQVGKVLLLRLMDRRGYIAHPFDFMPESNWDGLPDAYAPLLAWQRTIRAGPDVTESDPYAGYSRKEARNSYGALRADDPAKAQEWLETELKKGNAQNRLRLLQDLSDRFDRSDVDFLAELHASDRSSRVRGLVMRVLRRLGVKCELPTDLSALDYIERATKGLLKRRASFSAPAKMNTTRVNLLSGLISQLGFADLATELSVSETALIDGWDWDGSHATISSSLQRLILETGSDAACVHLFDRFPGTLLRLMHPSADEMQRLSSTLRDKAVEATIEAGCKSSYVFWNVPEAFCNWRIEGLSEAQSKTLWARAARHPSLAPPKDEKAPGLDAFAAEIFCLAMCLQPREAQSALDHFITRCALHGADPILAPFHFNVALPPVQTGREQERI